MTHVRRVFVIFTLCMSIAATTYAFWEIDIGSYGSSYWKNDSTWNALFNLANRRDYTYKLTARQYGRVVASGEFTVRRRGNSLQYTLSTGRMKEEGDTAYEPEALAGSVLLAAFDPMQAYSETERRMFMTPIMFMRWFSRFEQADFSNYFVWEQGSRPTVRFVAERHGWGSEAVYYGSLQKDWQTVLTLRIDLEQPLPLFIAFEDEGLRYEAELVTHTIRTPSLR